MVDILKIEVELSLIQSPLFSLSTVMRSIIIVFTDNLIQIIAH